MARRFVWLGVLSILLTILGCGGGGGGSQGTQPPSKTKVTGRIMDSAGDPVVGATVQITSDPVVTSTEAGGVFSAEVVTGSHVLLVTKDGVTLCQTSFAVDGSDQVLLGDVPLDDLYFDSGMDWYRDADEDGYSDGAVLNQRTRPLNYRLAVELESTTGDCADDEPNRNPGLEEVLSDGIDQNCDGSDPSGTLYYADADADGFGNAALSLEALIQPSGYVQDATDCDDDASAVHPEAVEICGDGIDNDCSDGDAGCSSDLYETVDGRGEILDGLPRVSAAGKWNVVRVDGQGNIHVAYHADEEGSDGGYALRYAFFDGSVWHVETVDDAGWTGEFPEFALDSTGTPHIVYHDMDGGLDVGNVHDSDNGTLNYAVKRQGTWEIETIDGPGVGWSPTIALDEQGNPHVCYFDYTTFTLKYAKRSEDTWEISWVDDVWVVGTIFQASLKIDALGGAHVVYAAHVAEDEPAHLRYAQKIGDSWQKQIVDDSGDTGFYADLELDSSDRPHIVYFESRDIADSACRYAFWNGTTWDLEVVDDRQGAGRWPSIVLDEHDQPHVAFNNPVKGNLSYAYRNDGKWIVNLIDGDPLDEDAPVGTHTSIDIDQSNRCVIGYTADDGGLERTDLHVVRFGAGPPEVTGDGTVELSGRCLDRRTDLPIAGAQVLLVNRQRVPYRSARTATDAAGNWALDNMIEGSHFLQIEHPDYLDLRETEVDVTSQASQSLDRTLIRGNIQVVAGVPSPLYSQGFSAPTAGLETSTTLNAAGRPVIAARLVGLDFDSDSKAVLYEQAADGTWASETVYDGQGIDGADPTVAVDAAGDPHVVFMREGLGITYGVRKDDLWQIEAIHEDLGPLALVEFQLDGTGRPYLVFYDADSDALMYSIRDGGQWTRETVDVIDHVQQLSLVVDDSGTPHIQYHTENVFLATMTSVIKYAVKIAGEWHIEQIDVSTNYEYNYHFNHSHMVLAEDGSPHVAYASAEALRHAYYASNGAWVAEVVELPGAATHGNKHLAMAQDGVGRVHVAYSQGRNLYGADFLRHCMKESTTWECRTLDDAGPDMGLYVSMVMDDENTLRISYQDSLNRTLRSLSAQP